MLIGSLCLGCDFASPGFEIENKTDGGLDIYYGSAVGVPIASGVRPGGKTPITRSGLPECTTADLVAVDEAGREVARRTPPLCWGDVWTIESPDH